MNQSIQAAIQSNKDHQYALKVYAERLEAELATAEKLLATAEYSDDESNVDVGGTLVVPNLMKPVAPIRQSSTAPDWPFEMESTRRKSYIRSISAHTMKQTELDALSAAVQGEQHRNAALSLQEKGHQALTASEPTNDSSAMNIDWNRVATKVSSSSASQYQWTAKECEIAWTGSRLSSSTNPPWSQEELTTLKLLIGSRKAGEIDWVEVAEKLQTNRTPVDCMRHGIFRKAHIWDAESDQRLLEAVQLYGKESWALVARYVSEDATSGQCYNRYTRSLDTDLARGSWSEVEDQLLRSAFEAFGSSWVEVAEFVPNRNSEQCRDRWQDALNPTITKSKWTEAEDEALLAAVAEIGEGRWKDISRKVGGGRNDSMCRGRYSVLMRRQRQQQEPESRPSTSAQKSEPVFVVHNYTPPQQPTADPSSLQLPHVDVGSGSSKETLGVEQDQPGGASLPQNAVAVPGKPQRQLQWLASTNFIQRDGDIIDARKKPKPLPSKTPRVQDASTSDERPAKRRRKEAQHEPEASASRKTRKTMSKKKKPRSPTESESDEDTTPQAQPSVSPPKEKTPRPRPQPRARPRKTTGKALPTSADSVVEGTPPHNPAKSVASTSKSVQKAQANPPSASSRSQNRKGTKDTSNVASSASTVAPTRRSARLAAAK